ncbi:Outer membrane protein assembly factor BamB, contains PQQ-like beta-propeller repeat [Candidatus Methanophagaceae archaeon]|nr:Outer membrane protein assembly factor BamB, contains PQQ-like beta-propeller repeat [Methanophagales archaeon]
MNRMNKIGLALLLSVILLISTLTTIAMASDWQQFHYDPANTGNSPSNAPDTNQTKWITDDLGAVANTQAVIKDNDVFVYADTQVHALNRDTGTIIWSTSIPGDTSGFGSWSSPAYSNNKLFVSSGYNLSRINAADGTLEQIIEFPDGGHSCNGGPTVADGKIFAGSGYDGNPVSYYYAFDVSDLTNVLWSFAVGSGECAGSTPAVAGDGVVFGHGSCLTRVNKTNGDLDWMTDISSGTIYGSAAIDPANDRVYVATASGSLALLHALNFTDGSLIWTSYSAIDFTDGTPAILDIDHVYISGNAYGSPGHTYCFNSTGIEQWRVPSGSWSMSPAVADGKLFTGDCDDMAGWGYFEGISAYNALDGTPIWSYEYAGSSPSIVEDENGDGMVISIGKGGVVYAFGCVSSIEPPVTPVLISGNVSYENGNPILDPAVTVTNLATSEEFTVETYAGSNYYLTLTDSEHVSTGDTIRITATDGSVSSEIERTVTESEMNEGGFVQDLLFESGPANLKVDIGNYSVAPGSTVTAPITLYGIQDYGTGTISVEYNPLVAHVTTVESSSESTVASYNIDNTNGTVSISAWNINGTSGNVMFANVTFEAVGLVESSTALNLTVTLLQDISYLDIQTYTANGTFLVVDDAPPVVSEPTATPDRILNDNGRARVPGTKVSQLSVYVEDVTGIASVTANLTPIWGPGNESVPMALTAGDNKSGLWSLNASAAYDPGVNMTHCLAVNATDVSGNSNTTQCILLTVLRRGDVNVGIVHDNVVDMGDALYIARYTVGKEPAPDQFVADVVGLNGVADCYNGVDMGDALYIARYTVGKEQAP